MIDKLISTDLAALATEDGQRIPTLDAMFAPPVPRVPRKREPWLAPAMPIVVAFSTAAVLMRMQTVGDYDSPNLGAGSSVLAVTLVLSVMAMFGVVGARPGRSSRPLAEIVAAGLFTLTAVIGFVLGREAHTQMCMFFDGSNGAVGPCQSDPLATRPAFMMFAWAASVVVGAVFARLVKRNGASAWSVPAKLVLVTVLITWLGASEYWDTWVETIHMNAAAPGYRVGEVALEWNRMSVVEGARDMLEHIHRRGQPGQLEALAAGLVLVGFSISIGVAAMRERIRPSRWLAMIESPAVIPLGVVVSTVSLVLIAVQGWLLTFGQGHPALMHELVSAATIGAVIAFASMLLRRRRREALS